MGRSKKSHILQGEDRTNIEDLLPENTMLKKASLVKSEKVLLLPLHSTLNFRISMMSN